MISLKRLEASGLTQAKLKSYFSDPQAETPARKLLDEIRDEIQDGVSRNLKDYRIFWAIDRAFDTPFYQLSYTKLKGLLSRKADSKEILKQVKDWGLVHLLPNEIDPATGKVCCEAGTSNPKKTLNLPVFFDVELPLMLAYLTIRWAKLFNDRNLVPLYKYEPLKFNKQNRMRCEIITELIQIMTNQYDYASDLVQEILQTLMYGICIKFPREAWHKEEQEDETGKVVVTKQGLRFNMPHPSRIYYDLFSRLSTINSDSGVKYAGYWEICRYKDIQNNPDYWNKDKITFGAVSWFNGFRDFFSTVYPCTLKFPQLPNDVSSTTTVAPIVGSLDRETEAGCYGSGDANAATLLTQHFKRIIPKEHGLGSYQYPIWLRLVVGNGETVHWAEPTGYTPAAYSGYDADQNRARHSSLALEIIPFQDHCSNIMTQWIYSMRQNLMNPTFVNTDLVPKEIIAQLENTGERTLRGKTFIPFSKTENIRQQIDHTDSAFESPQLTRHNTAEQAALLRGIIDLLDRLLLVSSQEVAQSAEHEQTAEEIRTINTTTSTRVGFTGSFIDRGIYATKKMLYDAYMVHGEEDFVVQISGDYADSEEEFKKLLDELDLELADDDDGPSATTTRRTVKGNKKALALELFSSSRDAANRIDNPGIAAAMSQIFTAIARNEVLIGALGPEQLVSLLNQIVQTAGLPKEFQMKAVTNTGQMQQQQQTQVVQEQLLKFAEQVKQLNEQTAKQVLDEVAKSLQPIAQAVQQLVQKDQQQDQQIQQLAEIAAQQKQAVEQVAQAISELTNGLAAAAQPQPAYDANQFGAPVGIS